MTAEALEAAADDLADRLARFGPDVKITRRRMAAVPTVKEGN